MTVVQHTGPALGGGACDWCHDIIRRGQRVSTVQHPDHHDPMLVHAGPVSYGASCVDAMTEAGCPDGDSSAIVPQVPDLGGSTS